MRFENFPDISLFQIWESFSAILRHELQLVHGVAYIYNAYSYTVPFQAFTTVTKVSSLAESVIDLQCYDDSMAKRLQKSGVVVLDRLSTLIRGWARPNSC